VPSAEQARLIETIPALEPIVRSLVGDDSSVSARASAVEFVLEGMHLSKRLNKDASGSGGGTYRSR
jgi:magnesium chelatase subunit I